MKHGWGGTSWQIHGLRPFLLISSVRDNTPDAGRKLGTRNDERLKPPPCETRPCSVEHRSLPSPTCLVPALVQAERFPKAPQFRSSQDALQESYPTSLVQTLLSACAASSLPRVKSVHLKKQVKKDPRGKGAPQPLLMVLLARSEFEAQSSMHSETAVLGAERQPTGATKTPPLGTLEPACCPGWANFSGRQMAHSRQSRGFAIMYC